MIVGKSQNFWTTLPSSNLTLHFDFSDTSTLWKTDTQGNNPAYSSQVTADGDVLAAANSLIPASSSDVIFTQFGNDSTARPVVKRTTPLLQRQCIAFDGSNDGLSLFERTSVSALGPSGYFSDTTYTWIVAARIASFPALENADLIFGSGDNSAFYGIYASNFSSVGFTSIGITNHDGNYDGVHLAASTDTNYVIMARHSSGTLYGSLNGGSESSVASGTTSDLTASIGIGATVNGLRTFDGRIGEIAVWDTALTGTTLTAAINYFKAKWL